MSEKEDRISIDESIHAAFRYLVCDCTAKVRGVVAALDVGQVERDVPMRSGHHQLCVPCGSSRQPLLVTGRPFVVRKAALWVMPARLSVARPPAQSRSPAAPQSAAHLP